MWFQRIGYVVIGGLLFLFYHLFVEFPDRIKDNNKDQIKASVAEGIKPLENSLTEIRIQLATLIAKSAASSKDPSKSITTALLDSLKGEPLVGILTAREVATAASEKRIAIDPQTLASVGEGLQQMGFKNVSYKSEVTKSLNALASYRSTLNIARAPPRTNVRQVPFTIEVRAARIPGRPVSQIGLMGMGEEVLADQGALYIALGNPPPQFKTTAKYYIVDATGMRVILDGSNIRNVIIQNATIEYDGGPVRLENIFFLNCTFRIKEGKDADRLQLSLFADAGISFSA